ncbi:response regulator transcription factor [Terriglobus sp. TAA 43]|uniref:response regulator transcription factor n=1 Tax=Terriglobus sp. TAA 43 TaxID=278961 RepID=UPI000646492C|nr:response regulator transcription factor [Terriglobus sp. TAA 43]
MRVLVVEDEPRLAENIATALREAGFAVDHAADGLDGSYCAEQGLYDLIILDLMLPGRDGKTVLQHMRRTNIKTPVLILTAREGKDSLIELLNAGADDYIGKPFDLRELIARAKALIRRSKGTASPNLQVGDISIDTVQQKVTRADETIDLSPTEYRILEYLAHHTKSIVPKKVLLEHLYDFEWEHTDNVIEVHIFNLRRKLTVPGRESIIETVRHRGYRIRSKESL